MLLHKNQLQQILKLPVHLGLLVFQLILLVSGLLDLVKPCLELRIVLLLGQLDLTIELFLQFNFILTHSVVKIIYFLLQLVNFQLRLPLLAQDGVEQSLCV